MFVDNSDDSYSGAVVQKGRQWLQCVSQRSGLPFWFLTSTLFLSIFFLMWLCCATATTATKQKSKVYLNMRYSSDFSLNYNAWFPEISIPTLWRVTGNYKRWRGSVLNAHYTSAWGWGGWRAGGRVGIGGGFELRSVSLFKCPVTGKSSWVNKVQNPHSSSIIVGQKNSMNDQKSLPRTDL